MTDLCVDSRAGVSLAGPGRVAHPPVLRWPRLSAAVRNRWVRSLGPGIMVWMIYAYFIVTTHHEAAATKSDAVLCKQPSQ